MQDQPPAGKRIKIRIAVNPENEPRVPLVVPTVDLWRRFQQMVDVDPHLQNRVKHRDENLEEMEQDMKRIDGRIAQLRERKRRFENAVF